MMHNSVPFKSCCQTKHSKALKIVLKTKTVHVTLYGDSCHLLFEWPQFNNTSLSDM